MEKFIFLFRGGNMQELTPEAAQSHFQKWYTWMQQLIASGNYSGGDPLEQTGKQVIGNNKTITDGPFIEAKEMVGGFMAITAKDMDHAIELAMDCPTYELNGKVEIRPVRSKMMN